jgi:hypothetical protein
MTNFAKKVTRPAVLVEGAFFDRRVTSGFKRNVKETEKVFFGNTPMYVINNLNDYPGEIVDAVTSRDYLSHPLRPKTRFTQGVGPTQEINSRLFSVSFSFT